MTFRTFVCALSVLFATACSGSSTSSPSSSNPPATSGSCASPTTATFSTNDGLAAATCAAVAWHSDAYLHGIETLGTLEADGTSASWNYSFSSPSAPCGNATTEQIEFSVITGQAVVSPGNSCTLDAKQMGPLTPPVDSKVIVVAGIPKIVALAPAGATITYAAYVNSVPAQDLGEASGGTWVLEGTWSGGFATLDFDASGNPGTSMGPCNTTTYTCP